MQQSNNFSYNKMKILLSMSWILNMVKKTVFAYFNTIKIINKKKNLSKIEI